MVNYDACYQVSGDWWRGSVAGREGLIPDKYILLKIRYGDIISWFST